MCVSRSFVSEPFATPWTVTHQAPVSFAVSKNLAKFKSIGSVILSNHLILCHPLLLLPSVFPSIRVFSNESCLSGGQSIGALASVLPMNIHGWFSLLLTGLISLQSKRLSSVFSSTIIQKHQENIKLWHSAFFMVQLSHLCITPEKTAALTMQTFVSIVVSLLFNMLSRFVIAFRDPPKSPSCHVSTTVSSEHGSWLPHGIDSSLSSQVIPYQVQQTSELPNP